MDGVEKNVSQSALRLAVDARNLTRPVSGIARMIATAIEALAEAGMEIDLLLPAPLHDDFNSLKTFEKVRVYESRFRSVAARLWWGRSVLPRLLRRLKPDVFWAPAHRLSHKVSIVTPSVLTIHDMTWKFAPETMLYHRRIADRVLTGRAIKSADRVIAISNATAQDIAGQFPEADNKIRVVSNIVAPRAEAASCDRLKSLGVVTPYCLFVGTLEPRKNLVRAVEAFLAVPKHQRKDMRFVIAGARGWHASGIDRAIGDAGEYVRSLGRTDEATLSRLYKDCEFLVMPSVYEGFGYPVIEAQQYGKRVLTSAGSPMAEIGGNTVVLVDPLDVSSISEGMKRCLSGENGAVADEAIENAERFRPEVILPQLVAVFAETSLAQ